MFPKSNTLEKFSEDLKQNIMENPQLAFAA